MAEGDRERWDRRWADASHADGAPPDWFDAFEWPNPGRGLDIASGTGRIAMALAERGYATLALDVSPAALAKAAAAGADRGLEIETRVLDLDREALPAGPFAVITCFWYLNRDLFGALAERLAPGGLLVCEIPTVQNLERHAKPSRRFLLETGELALLVGGLDVVYSREGWFFDRAVARVAARRPAE